MLYTEIEPPFPGSVETKARWANYKDILDPVHFLEGGLVMIVVKPPTQMVFESKEIFRFYE